jgi:hypothetical protein
MRIVVALLGLTVVAAWGSCATTYQIRPAAGGDLASRSAAGLSMVVDPDAWEAQPYDLADYMTPIAIRIINNSGQDVRVSYADFALVNEQGFRYSAVNPYGLMGSVGQRPPLPEAEPGLASAETGEAKPVLVAARARLQVVPGRRFFVYPRARYVFRYYDPWPYGWVEPFYGPYVSVWSGAYYPSNPTEDILRLGMPEGVVRPGGQVSGFVYFQNAGQRSTRLQLTWSAHTPD